MIATKEGLTYEKSWDAESNKEIIENMLIGDRLYISLKKGTYYYYVKVDPGTKVKDRKLKYCLASHDSFCFPSVS